MADIPGATAYTLMIGLLGTLKKKGILSQPEIVEMIDLALLGLEEMGLGSVEPQAVYNMLKSTQAMIEGKPHPDSG